MLKTLADLKRIPVGTNLTLIRRNDEVLNKARTVAKVQSNSFACTGDGDRGDLLWLAFPKAKDFAATPTGFIVRSGQVELEYKVQREKKLFEVTIRREFSVEYQAKWRAPYNYPDHEESKHPEWSFSRDDVAARWARSHDRAWTSGYKDAVTEIREVPEQEVAERRAKLKSWHQACCDLAIASPCVCAVSYICPEHGSRHVGTHD